jgi:predicted acetyltransferase
MMLSDVRTPREPAELEALAPILAWAFGMSAQDSLKWLASTGLQHVRMGYSAARVVAGLVEIPMGQWFGGKSVPMLGVAGVATAPEARGQGLALALMRALLSEARARQFALSALYPATVALYRKAGYELAGAYCRFTLPLKDCPQPRSALALRSATPEDDAAIERLYRTVASERNGYLDRGPYVWARVRAPQGEPARVLVVEGSAGIEGYAALSQLRREGIHHDLALGDLVGATPGAMARLLRFLSDHRTTADNAIWYGGAADARLFAFPERSFKIEVQTHWMLRLVDVASALLARGYPEVTAELDLFVEDDVLPANNARYRLRLRDGTPELDVAASGDGAAARLDVRALTALYSGVVTPAELVRAGMLSADARTLAALGRTFAGGAPAMADYF